MKKYDSCSSGNSEESWRNEDIPQIIGSSGAFQEEIDTRSDVEEEGTKRGKFGTDAISLTIPKVKRTTEKYPFLNKCG